MKLRKRNKKYKTKNDDVSINQFTQLARGNTVGMYSD